jgi:hypothetical protein
MRRLRGTWSGSSGVVCWVVWWKWWLRYVWSRDIWMLCKSRIVDWFLSVNWLWRWLELIAFGIKRSARCVRGRWRVTIIGIVARVVIVWFFFFIA